MNRAGELIEAAGGGSRVARELQTTPQAVSKWKRTGRVPADRVVDLIRLSGIDGVTPEELRPDVFKRAAQGAEDVAA